MTTNPNCRDTVIQIADRLFVRYGYHATSMRQIATEADCTVPAIYYHFKNGKRELFQTTLESHLLDLKGVLKECESEQTLAETIKCIGELMKDRATTDLKRWCWIAAEFSLLTVDERLIVRKQLGDLRNELVACLQPFFHNAVDTQQAAWMILSATLGYAQLSALLESGHFTLDHYTEMIRLLLAESFFVQVNK